MLEERMSSLHTRKKKREEKKQNKKSKWNICLLIVYTLLAVALTGVLFYANIKVYSIHLIFPVVVGLLWLLFVRLIASNKARKTTSVLLVILNALFSVILYYAHSTVQLVNTFNSTTTKTELTMSVVVLKNSAIQTLEDVKNKKVAAPTGVDSENITKFLEHLSQEKQTPVTVESVNSYATAYSRLLNGEDEVILLNSAYEGLLALEDAEYASKIKKVYEYKITNEVTTTTTANRLPSKEGVFTLYISGIDTYGPITSVSRSDVNILMTVNMNTHKILLTTTPRDAYVAIADGGQNQYDKLTHAGVYGVEASIHTLENLYGISIDYYTRVNFTSFLKIIDTVGGVDVYNSQEFTSLHGGYYFPVGMVHLNSEQALGFVRERYSLSGGDNDRASNQQKVITAIAKKLTSPSALTNFASVVSELSGAVQTNMSVDKIMEFVNQQLQSGGEFDIESQALTGTGRMDLPSYAMPNYQLYMMQVSEASLAQVKSNIQSVIEGQ